MYIPLQMSRQWSQILHHFVVRRTHTQVGCIIIKRLILRSLIFSFYVDDSTLTSILHAFNLNNYNNNSDKIYSELNNISNWYKLHQLSLNTTKAKCMVFHMPQKCVMYPNLKIDHIEIERVKEFNFLGIVLNEQLT